MPTNSLIRLEHSHAANLHRRRPWDAAKPEASAQREPTAGTDAPAGSLGARHPVSSASADAGTPVGGAQQAAGALGAAVAAAPADAAKAQRAAEREARERERRATAENKQASVWSAARSAHKTYLRRHACTSVSCALLLGARLLLSWAKRAGQHCGC